MPRLAPLKLEDAPDLADSFTAAEEMMGFTPNDGLIMARRPDITKALGALVAAIYAPGKVDNGLKRLIGEATSKAAGCVYCTAHAAHGAHRAGVPTEKIDAVWSYQESPLFTDAERAAIRVAMGAGVSPNAVTDEDFEALKAHYDDDAIVEIVSVIAMFGFLNRWNSTLATELEATPAAFLKHLRP